MISNDKLDYEILILAVDALHAKRITWLEFYSLMTRQYLLKIKETC